MALVGPTSINLTMPVGRIDRPQLSLARVVAAFSAFPPLLSPVRINLGDQVVVATDGVDLHRHPFIETAVLTDGGVYDNLGLERIWKRCKTILVSNAGRTLPEIGAPTGRWVGQTFRTVQVIHQQSENARRRLLFGMANHRQRAVAYWGIDCPISSYGLEDGLPVIAETSASAAAMRTRLNPFKTDELETLLATGYAGADASLRLRRLVTNNPAARFPRLPL